MCRHLGVWFMVLVFLSQEPVSAMIQPLIGGQSTTVSASAVNYLSLSGDDDPRTTEFDSEQVIPHSGTLSDLSIVLSGAPNNGVGTQSYTLTVRLCTPTCADTALSCVISEDATTCTDTDSIAVTAGDLVDLTVTPASTPVARYVLRAVTYHSDTTALPNHNSVLLGGTTAIAVSTTVDNYLAVHSLQNGTATEFDAQTLIPTQGIIKSLYVVLDTSPTQSYAFTVRNNATNQSLTCTVSGAATTCNDTTNSFSVVAGDQVSVLCDPSATAPTAAKAKVSVVFEATTNGEFIIASVSSANLSATAVRYGRPIMGNSSYSATESDRQQLVGPEMFVTNLYVVLSAAPNNGAGTQSYAFQFRDDAANDGSTCTISENATTCNNATLGTLEGSDKISNRSTPSGTPVAVKAQIASTGYVPPRRMVLIQ